MVAILAVSRGLTSALLFGGVVWIVLVTIWLLSPNRPDSLTSNHEQPLEQANARVQLGKENATLLMLARNVELYEVMESMRRLEDRFNRNYKYPWTFFNDEPFTEGFKKITSEIASGKAEYIQIPEEHWSVPSWINKAEAARTLRKYAANGIPYGGSLSYRHMCRWNSGFFFREEALNKYEWYWRVEPGVEYYCDQQYDPFTYMRKNGKVYGFTMTLREIPETIATLWKTISKFFRDHPTYVHPKSASRTFLLESTEEGQAYTSCHFWSNFEIGNLNFFRSQKYLEYPDHLDKSGGFFYERWGDAPVHTNALVMMLDKSQIHFFGDIGYYHSVFGRCPKGDDLHSLGRCLCPKHIPGYDFDYSREFPRSALSPRPLAWKGGNQRISDLRYTELLLKLTALFK